MLGPSLTGSVTHYKLGTISFRVLPFLILGSSIGAFIGSKFSLSLNEIQQRSVFGVTMTGLAFRNFLKYFRSMKK